MTGRMLVTGGGGVLGSRVVSRAVAAGWQVVATIRTTTAPQGVDARVVDLADPVAVAALVDDVGPDVIVHTAYDKRDNGPASVTRAGTIALAEATSCRLLFTSTDIVFSGRAGRPYTELDPPDPVNDYGAAKAWVEAQLADRPDTLITRLSLLIDPDRGEQIELVRASAEGEATLFTDEIRCPTLVDDVATALVELAAMDTTGVLHVGGPQALDRAALGRLLAPAAGVDPDALSSGPQPTGVSRPADVRLDSAKAVALGLRLRPVSDGLR